MQNRIKDIRESMDLKQVDMCKEFDVSNFTFSGWENDNDNIPLKSLVKFSNLYGYSIDYILYLSNSNTKYDKLETIDPKVIGDNLKEIRLNNSLLQKDIAKICGIRDETYCRYERGKKLINSYCLYIICTKFNKSMDGVLGRKETIAKKIDVKKLNQKDD